MFCIPTIRGFAKLALIIWTFIQIGVIVAYIVTTSKWFDVKSQFWVQIVDLVVPTLTLVVSFFIKSSKAGFDYDGKEGAKPTLRLRFIILVLITYLLWCILSGTAHLVVTLAIYGKISSINPETNSGAENALGNAILPSDPKYEASLIISSVMIGVIYFGMFLAAFSIYLFRPRTYKYHGYA